jgi:hypothetical protein
MRTVPPFVSLQLKKRDFVKSGNKPNHKITGEGRVVWVQIRRLHLEYYDEGLIDRNGNQNGRTVRIDDSTSEGSQASLARISAEEGFHTLPNHQISVLIRDNHKQDRWILLKE